jgi:thiol:disulfide interchange protein DsbD
MHLRSTLLASFLLLLATAAFAGDTPPVTVDAKLSQPQAAPGDGLEAKFHLQVPDGWHIYPPGSNDGIPVEAKLEPAVPGIAPGALEVKSGQKDETIEGIGKIAVLEGACDLTWKLAVARDAAPGPRKLEGKFVYQACNDKTCDMPKEVAFTLTLEVGAPEANVGPPIELPASQPATANFSLSPQQAAPGQTVTAALDLFVAPGFHVYAPGTEGDRATRLELDLPQGWTASELAGPPPTRTETDEIGKAVLWEGKLRLTRTFVVPASAAAGSVHVALRASWLACDPRKCVPGKDAKTLDVAVSGGGAAPGADSAPSSPSAGAEPTMTLGALVLAAISLGLANILMPCTFPMIPITISIFSKGKKLSRKESMFRAAVYAGGIIISFTLMGGVVQVAFAGQGQALIRTIANNGPLNLGIAVLFIYFALSFFGYYEIELPEFIRNFVQKSVDKAKTTGGAPGETGIPLPALFLMGFFFVLTSYTCGAPLVFSLLAVGLKAAGKASIILSTAVFGATTAAPFFLLALVPGALKSLPRSGGWFKTFKVVLGVVELAAALKFLSTADVYWHEGASCYLTPPVFLALWIAAGVFMTLYVAHVIKLAHDEDHTEAEPKFQPKAWLRATPFILLTAYLAANLSDPTIPPDGPPGSFAHVRNSVAGNLLAFLPPEPRQADTAKGGTDGAPSHAGPFARFASYEDALAAARTAKKRLFVEFTGHNCINCRKMERTVLIAPRIVDTFKNLETGSLFTDASTPEEQANLKTQTERLGGSVIPAYYVVDPASGKVLSEEVGACSEDEFLAFLKKGLD